MLALNAMAPISIECVSGLIGFPNLDRTATFLSDIHQMEAGSSQICDRFGFLTRVFLQFDGHRLARELRRAPSKSHRTFGRPNLPRPRHSLLWVLTNA